MNEKPLPYSLLSSITFWYIALTTAYISAFLLLNMLGMPHWLGTAFGAALGLLGFFVPVGVLSSLYIFSHTLSDPYLIAKVAPLIFAVLIGEETLMQYLRISQKQRIAIIFGTLFFLTLAIDLIIYGRWASLDIFTAADFQLL